MDRSLDPPKNDVFVIIWVSNGRENRLLDFRKDKKDCKETKIYFSKHFKNLYGRGMLSAGLGNVCPCDPQISKWEK